MVKKPQNKSSDPYKSRMVALTILLFLAFLIIIGRLFLLQVVWGKDYKGMAEDQYTLVKKLTPTRGEIKITDRYTNEPYTVATSIQRDLAFAVPSAITDSENFVKNVSEVLGLDPLEVTQKISDKTKKYMVLKRQLTDAEEQKLKDLKLVGLNFEPETVRFYPEKSFLSQVLGYVGYQDNEKTGRYGLEQYFNDQLSGKAGSVDQEKDAGGVWIFGGKRDIVPAINGDNIILTIDKNIQFQSETILKDAVEKHGADSGSVIVMDPKTGAVLAMATYPTFDPNEYAKVKKPQIFSNQPTVNNYEPGSIFKPITMAAVVNEGKVTPDSTYVDPGELHIDGYTIRNSDSKAHGTQTMSQVLEESLNTGVVYAKNKIGNKTFYDYIKRFGFGQQTGIELPEAKGDLSGLSGNIEVNYATASFGQGISVTPIQLMQAYTALANGGKMMKPYIVQATIDYRGKVKNTEPQMISQVISPSTASMVSAMLVNVVELGHGKKAGVKQYYVAGKTGTAQVPRADGKGYEANNNIGSFIGYAPVENPRFLALVRINHPRDVTFAESSAAPTFGELAQFILNYYSVSPTRAAKP
jgi:cell division protein FtsI/penicillin-binding protein 2